MEVKAVKIDELVGYDVNDDQSHVLVKLRAGDNEIVLALANDVAQMTGISMLAATARNLDRKRLAPVALAPIQVAHWQIARTAGGFCLSLELPSGGWIDLLVPALMADGIRQSLATAAAADVSTAQEPKTKLS